MDSEPTASRQQNLSIRPDFCPSYLSSSSSSRIAAFLNGVAGDQRTRRGGDRFGTFDAAAHVDQRATRMKGAAGWRIDRARHLAADPAPASAGDVQAWHRFKQQARIGMARPGEDRLRRSLLDDAAKIHDAEPVGHVAHGRQVVADEQVGQAEPRLEVLHQVEDLGLHRYVERAGRLVADQEFRRAGQRAGDRDALTLTAAELVRVFLPVGSRQPDLAEQELECFQPGWT